MKKIYFFIACLAAGQAYGQIRINEFLPETGEVELINLGGSAQDASTLVLCSFPTYNEVGSLTLVSGNLVMGPGELLVVSGHNMSQADDELGIYTASDFTNPAAMEDYVEWGSHGHQRSTVAESAGIWADLDFVPEPPAGSSLAWDGTSDASSAWHEFAEPNLGSENFPTSIDMVENSDIEIWPIPTSTSLNLKVQMGSAYQLFDVVGNLVESGVTQSNIHTLDMSALHSGYYILKTNGVSTRVIKN
jgi:hypothetical protein